MFNMESRHLLNLSVQNALDHTAENFNLKNFLGGACARNSLEKCTVRSPDGRYCAHITSVYTECKYGGPLGWPGSSCAKARLVRPQEFCFDCAP